MATDDLLRKRRDPTAPGLVDPTRPGGAPQAPGGAPPPPLTSSQVISDAYRSAGGGAPGAGAGIRAALGQYLVRGPLDVGNAVTRAYLTAGNTVLSPVQGFAEGLLYGGPKAQQGAVPATAAPTSTGPVPSNFGVPAGLFTSDAQRRALFPDAAGRLSPDGQIAKLDAGLRELTPAGPAITGVSSPSRGTAQFGNQAVQTIPSNYGAGRTNVVSRYTPQSGQGQGFAPPSFAPPGQRPFDGYNPASSLNFTPLRPGAQSSRPRGASSRAEARSQQLDGMLQQIIRQAQQTPGSYGELFARRGTLAALGALAPLAQAAGSNVIQGVGDEMQADTARYGIDTGYAARLGDQAITREGQALQERIAQGAQGVNQEGNYLQALIAQSGQRVNQEGNYLQAQTAREAAERNAQAAIAAAQLGLTRDANKPVTTDQLKAQLGRMLVTGLNADGTALSPEQRAQVEATLRQLQPGGLQLFPAQ